MKALYLIVGLTVLSATWVRATSPTNSPSSDSQSSDREPLLSGRPDNAAATPQSAENADSDSQLAEQPLASMLGMALAAPNAFMFAEQTTSKVDADNGKNFNLVITSARGEHGEAEQVVVRRGTMRIFWADARVDEFTQQGGWHWRCGETEGQAQFTQPGAVIMVVYQQDGVVQWYALQLDIRC